VENILKNPHAFDWSAQGLGMLRLYLAKPAIRLHIWDSSLKIPGVSALHTHPWHFDSLVIAGVLHNRRYLSFAQEHATTLPVERYNTVELTCGENACTHGEPIPVWLHEQGLETYRVGQTYHQQLSEIHLSLPEDGTITLVERRVPDGQSADKAEVLWRGRGQWIDAKPRPATKEEVETVTKRSLETWF
jgi:hypothetical protein